MNGEIEIIIGEPQELQNGMIAVLSFDAGGGVVQPSDILKMGRLGQIGQIQLQVQGLALSRGINSLIALPLNEAK